MPLTLLPLELPRELFCDYRVVLCHVSDVESFFSGESREYLTRNEQVALGRIKDGNYRRFWRLGRLLLKGMYHSVQRETPETVVRADENFLNCEIASRNGFGQGIRPELTVRGVPANVTLSLSHAETMICAGIGLSRGNRLGVDVTPIGKITPAVIRQFFTREERRLLEGKSDREGLPECLWSAKEAAYKALNEGEPFMPNRFRLKDYKNERLLYSYQDQSGIRETVVFIGEIHGTAYAIALPNGSRERSERSERSDRCGT